jgi:hypothetical protein
LAEAKHLSLGEYFRMYTTTEVDVETISRIILKVEQVYNLTGHGTVKIIIVNKRVKRIITEEDEILEDSKPV